MAKKAGMDLEDAANKVAIPGHGHKGPHPQAYHEAVYSRLQKAVKGLSGDEYSAAFKAELEAIKKDATTTGSDLSKLLTKQ